MGSNLSADIWVGCSVGELEVKEAYLEEQGIDVENYREDPDDDIEYDEMINDIKGVDYTISYDSEDMCDRIVGICISKTADWSALEVDLDVLKQAEVEATLKLQEIFSDDIEVKTYIVPSYF